MMFDEDEDQIEATWRVWHNMEKLPNQSMSIRAYDNSKEPRPQGRYLLLTWDGKTEFNKFYRSNFRRYLAYLLYYFRKP